VSFSEGLLIRSVSSMRQLELLLLEQAIRTNQATPTCCGASKVSYLCVTSL
jgi:hypothetical protein